MKRELLSAVLARALRKNQTDVEKLLWNHLRNRQMTGIKFRRQQPIGSYIVDFVSFERKIIIELDGGYHNDEAQKRKDDERSEWLKSIGYNVLRFWNNEIIENIEGVLETITLTQTLSLRERVKGEGEI